MRPDHRDYLRFFWWANNDPAQPIVEYRMRVHLFGNRSSPGVAIHCLQFAAEKFGNDEVSDFIKNHFYVDDGLKSFDSAADAIRVLEVSRAALANCNIRLHKLLSNNSSVLQAFDDSEHADESISGALVSRVLGVTWDIKNDKFLVKTSKPTTFLTKRSLLSIINAVFDPLGFVSPVVLQGRQLLRKLTSKQLAIESELQQHFKWDDPLPKTFHANVNSWLATLPQLESIAVPRVVRLPSADKVSLHVFSDASNDAIGNVLYFRSNKAEETVVRFLQGESRLHPLHANTIPRLELCAAVAAVTKATKFLQESSFEPSSCHFYTDSMIVLGYIQNTTRKFSKYVSNRVAYILKHSSISQWTYVNTKENPADIATRGASPQVLKDSNWFTGPSFLKSGKIQVCDSIEDNLPEELVSKTVLASSSAVVKPVFTSLIVRFARFSSWASLRRALFVLKKFLRCRKAVPFSPVALLDETEHFIISQYQQHHFKDLNLALMSGEDIHSVPIRKLSPFLDGDSIIRVGGRLRFSDLSYDQKYPILIPKDTHLSYLLVSFAHDLVHHQGRHLTLGKIVDLGFFIFGVRSYLRTFLHSCVTCRKLRAKAFQPKMADLPPSRVRSAPPFTDVGLDVFGPLKTVTRKTRNGCSSGKRWVLMITCLASRAVHLELLEEMSTDSFINAFRRFVALRGQCRSILCDNGSNFVGAKNALEKSFKELDHSKISNFLLKSKCDWHFTPVQKSNFGGVYERKIGSARRILEGMLQQIETQRLSCETLATFLAEVSATINSTPLTEISTDVDSQLKPLTPAMLLTQKEYPHPPLPGIFEPPDRFSRKRWRQVQYLANQFWSRWRKEYLPRLQERRKWHTTSFNFKLKDVVLVMDKDTSRNEWLLGRVVSLVKSFDGVSRTADVFCAGKTVNRAISGLIFIYRP